MENVINDHLEPSSSDDETDSETEPDNESGNESHNEQFVEISYSILITRKA